MDNIKFVVYLQPKNYEHSMKYELNFYKQSGKWYTQEVVETDSESLIENYPYYTDMDYTVHIIEEDGYLQPYRIYKRLSKI